MSLVYFLVQQMMLFSIPLLIVALGGMFCERSGVINIALEGIMVLGGFTGILFINLFQGVLPGQPVLLIALIISMVTGMVISLVHAYASVNMKANQSISGTAINMFAPAFAIFVARVIRNVQQIPFENQFRIEKVPVLGDIPIIGGLFFQNAYLTTYLGIIILVISCIVLYKTRFGLRLRACGEHPQAAASVGISVYKMRYMGVLISGALARIGGLVYVIPTSTSFNASVSGYGFLALAVLIFGQWKPGKIMLAALFFGFMKTISSVIQEFRYWQIWESQAAYISQSQYLATLIVLTLNTKGSQAPKASGVPYDKGAR